MQEAAFNALIFGACHAIFMAILALVCRRFSLIDKNSDGNNII